MSENRQNQQTPDAAAQREQQATPPRRNEPWTGQGPVIRNLPNSSQPYGASPDERKPQPVRRTLSPWIVVAIIAILAVIIAAIVLAIVL